MTLTTSYTYDEAGNLASEATPDGITAKYTYDRAGRLLELANVTADATLSRFSYGLDRAGNRTVLSTTRGSEFFTYDPLNRLTGVCYNSSCAGGQSAVPCLGCVGPPATTPPATTIPDPADLSTTYTYDSVGNRMTDTDYRGTTAYTYDDADRLTSRTPPGGPTVAYGYDNNGNQTAAGPNTFGYDLAGRLASARVGATTETYAYAGDGVRVSAMRSGGSSGTTQFVVDRSFSLPQIAQERDASDGLVRSYEYGLDPISQSTATGAFTYLHHDPLGSVTDLTTSTGTSLAWTEYEPFGGTRSAGVAAGAPSSGLGFTGQYLDAASGLYHLRARQYDPLTGRFTALDPAAASTSEPYVNAYGYGANNPIRYTDPSGRCFVLCGAAVGAVIGGLISLGTYVATAGSDFSLQGAVGATVVGAAAGAVTGATLGLASGIELPLVESVVLRATGGYVGGIVGLAGAKASGGTVTAVGAATQILGGVAGGAIAPLMEGGFTAQFTPKALFGDARAAGSLGIGIGLGLAGTK